MKLRELLELCNGKLFLIIEDNEGTILTDGHIDVEDYFAYGQYRELDDNIVDFIDAEEMDISTIPVLIITVREDIYG